MSHTLVVGKNTYSTEAEALAYLETRLRSMTAWAALTTASKLAALSSAFYLLESLWAWKGERTNVTQLASVAIVAAGTGYVVGEIATINGGAGEKAQAKVTSIGGGGAVTGLQLIHIGYYTTAPSGTLATTASAAGVNLTVSFTAYATQQSDWPRKSTGITGVVDGTVPDAIKQAQAQLAFELTQDADLETATNASQNTRSMAVGSLRIEYFRSETRNRFPQIVWGIIAEYVGGDNADAMPKVFGTDGETSFGDANPFPLGRGGY